MYPTLVATMLSTGAMLLTSGDKSRGHRNELLITFATEMPAAICLIFDAPVQLYKTGKS
jgi:hypothetical protein